MSKIQFIDLDMSSEDEETGGVVISKHEMQSRLGWLSTKVKPQMKQETETRNTIEDIEKIHEVVHIEDTQENQTGDTLTSIDTLEVTDVIKDNCGKTNKEQEKEEESLTKPTNLSTIIEREVAQLTTTEATRDIGTTEAEP